MALYHGRLSIQWHVSWIWVQWYPGIERSNVKVHPDERALFEGVACFHIKHERACRINAAETRLYWEKKRGHPLVIRPPKASSKQVVLEYIVESNMLKQERELQSIGIEV